MFDFIRNIAIRSFKNPLIFGSFLMLLGTNAGNIFQFLFNIFMTRNLSVVDYGILASLMSLLTLPSLFSNAIFPTIVSFAATYFADNKFSQVKNLFLKVAKVSYGFGVMIFIFMIIFSRPIGEFFKISETSLIVVAGINVFIGFAVTINSALLQAKLEFRFMSFLNFFGSLLKLIFGAGFVLLGFSVGGAMFGMFLSGLAIYIISFVPLRSAIFSKENEKSISYNEILSFGAPAALIFFSLTSFVALDIILVKHFFDPFQAGLYAGLSILGRIIFYLTAPINAVVLPLLTQQYIKKEAYQKTVYLALFLVGSASACMLLIYSLWPSFIITFFLKNEYLLIMQYLFIFSLFTSLYSLVYILCNIFLAIKRTEIYVPLSVGAVLQVFLIWFFHNSFSQVIWISLIIMAILLIILLVYYWHISHEKNFGKKKRQ